MSSLYPFEVNAHSAAARHVPAGVKRAVLDLVAELLLQASARWGVSVPAPEVAFDLRGTTAGAAGSPPAGSARAPRLQFNATLLRDNASHFFADTIPHEVAHLVTRALEAKTPGAKWDPHGPQWQAIMRSFGVEPSRCHDLDVRAARVGGSWRFRCACRTFELGKRKATGLLQEAAMTGTTSTICRACKTMLVFDGIRTTAAGEERVDIVPRFAVVGGRKQLSGLSVVPARPARSPVERTAPVSAASPQDTPPATAVSSPVPPMASSATQPATPALAPSDAQLSFARDIARRRGVDLPEHVLRDRRAISDWIGRNR